MTSVSTVEDWAGHGLAHEAFIFGSGDLVRARVVPFAWLRASVSPLVVHAGDSVRGCWRSSARSSMEFATFADSETQWTTGARPSPATRGMAPLIESGKPWRLVGERTWLSQPGGDLWSR